MEIHIADTKNHGKVKSNAEYIYGDTDSVFFAFNLQDLDGNRIVGKKALEITIELAIEAGKMATKFLKAPHDLEYEKTFLPFALLSKKRYVGMLFEEDPDVGYRKEMGIVLKRRDNAPIVKDVYGGIIDILMKEQNVDSAVKFLKSSLQEIVDEKIPKEKLIITKSLRSHYKNQIKLHIRYWQIELVSETQEINHRMVIGFRLSILKIQKREHYKVKK